MTGDRRRAVSPWQVMERDALRAGPGGRRRRSAGRGEGRRAQYPAGDHFHSRPHHAPTGPTGPHRRLLGPAPARGSAAAPHHPAGVAVLERGGGSRASRSVVLRSAGGEEVPRAAHLSPGKAWPGPGTFGGSVEAAGMGQAAPSTPGALCHRSVPFAGRPSRVARALLHVAVSSLRRHSVRFSEKG